MSAPLIVGGGPAGAAAAIVLARAGLAPRLIERSEGPRDIVCGGFLGWDALAALDGLGIDARALGARPITRLRIVAGHREVEAPLPHTAMGLSRRTLDAVLLARASEAGAIVTSGVAVRSVDPAARSLRLQDGDEIGWDALLLATGKHELRGLARPLTDRRARLAVGLRASLPPSPARDDVLGGVIELHPFDGGYVGLLVQENGATNLCLSVSQARLVAAGTPAALLAELVRDLPALAERIGADLPDELTAIAGVPYGWRALRSLPGIFRIGDQGAVTASLAGDGIAMALTSGMSAAEALLAGGPSAAEAWQAGFARRSRRPLALAEMLRRSAERPLARAVVMNLLRVAPGLTAPAALLTRIA